MDLEKLKLKIPTSRQKLQQRFPQDPRADIKIQQSKKIYKLQRAFLRLQSGYFKKVAQNINQVVIKQPFNIARSDILQYYEIVKFLQIQNVIKHIKEDIIQKIDHYEIFQLMQLAHKYNEQEIFEICFNLFQKQNFQQIRYTKHQLLKCPAQIFKLIITANNRHKSQKGLGIPVNQIQQIVRQYAEQHKMDAQSLNQFKSFLFNIKNLTSAQYKEVYWPQAQKKLKKKNTSLSMIKSTDPTYLSSINYNNQILAASKLTQSVIDPRGKEDVSQIIVQTYQKKRNQQLQTQNKFLNNQLLILKKQAQINKKNFQQIKNIVAKLQQMLQQKDKIDKQQAKIIKKLQKDCQQLKKDLNQKSQLLKKLQQKILKLQKIPSKIPTSGGGAKFIKYDEDQQSRTIQSQIVPGHLLKQIAKPAAEALNPPVNNVFKKSNKLAQVQAQPVSQINASNELDEIQLQQLYSSRLQFDKQPRSCPKKYLPKLANFITGDGFQKKRLTMIFRKNINNQDQFGNHNHLRNRNALLVIITTKTGQIIGGYVSVQINKNDQDYIKDENAFIFNLTKNQKFNIRKTSVNQALFITNDYLICFSNDLMISIDCIKNQSQSAWPCAYESGKQKKSSKWLTGQQGSFSIKQIEVFQVNQQQMIMDL